MSMSSHVFHLAGRGLHVMLDGPGRGGLGSLRLIGWPRDDRPMGRPVLEVALRRRLLRAHVRAAVDSMSASVQASAGLGPVAVYLAVEDLWDTFRRRDIKAPYDRELSLRIDHDTEDTGTFSPHIHWRLWAPASEWSSTTPRWRDGGVFPLEVLFGRAQVHRTRCLEARRAFLRLPEGEYFVSAVLDEVSFGFERLPLLWRKARRTGLEFDPPLPYGRHGGISSWSRTEPSIDAALDAVRTECLKQRDNTHPPPDPAEVRRARGGQGGHVKTVKLTRKHREVLVSLADHRTMPDDEVRAVLQGAGLIDARAGLTPAGKAEVARVKARIAAAASDAPVHPVAGQ